MHGGRARSFFLILSLALAVQACGGARPHTAPTPPLALKGPAFPVDGAKIAPDRERACAQIERLQAPPERYPMAAEDAGMLPDDFEAIRRTLDGLDVAVTFRDSNPASFPHLRAGMESKGHDVMTKTFTLESLPPGFAYLAGTVSTLDAKPKRGEIISDPLSKRYLTPAGNPLTGDYDMMDMLGADGQRVVGESARDLEVREALNAGLPLRGTPAHRVDRIKHGAQAEYANFLREMARKGHAETAHPELLAPEAPLTLFDQKGRIYRFGAVEEELNFYRCSGAGAPPEWNIVVRP
jgi:hypothetical protein